MCNAYTNYWRNAEHTVRFDLMKYFWISALFGVAIYAFSGCASTTSKTAGGEPIPGEQKSEDQRIAPSTSSLGAASVRW